MPTVAIIGDYHHDRSSHRATNEALSHSSKALALDLHAEWVAPASIEKSGTLLLQSFDAFFIAPSGPFAHMKGVLTAIRFARETGRPLIGTCGGFQLVVVEFMRNVLGLADAAHAESTPDAPRLAITPLACSLVGKTFAVDLRPDSRAFCAYGHSPVMERYQCSYGLNPVYRQELETSGLITAGVEADNESTEGEPRILELPIHPFFIATLFVPQTQSTAESPHPLINAFLIAASRT